MEGSPYSGSAYGGGYPGGERMGGGAYDDESRRFDRVDPGNVGSHGAHPMSSPVGGAYGGTTSTGREAAILREAGRYGGGSQTQAHDPHYSEWRRRQIEELDRDYEEYRREHQTKFDSEFAGWRTRRQGQRQLLGRVDEHMDVVGSDGTHLGTVDKVVADRIILTKSDPSAGGQHHSIPCGWVETVDTKVTLNRTAEDARSEWRNEERSRALFERPEARSDGPHVLNRSFAGTYDEREDGRTSERGTLGDANPTDRTGRTDRIDPKR
ncbi:DUF2171 domain-containing protein [Sphingomonas parva]|uniref:DUF2171 domain-containing protein n=2 Tax=Sphingomonas parva TaxID=2555898 RepID=A0A4Y8ZRW4_9SPHN|nr:DUF2171 domain-containing protein [Sphingomonas parva]